MKYFFVASLLILVEILILLNFYIYSKKNNSKLGNRERILFSSILFSLIVLISIEGLSVQKLLTKQNIYIFWILAGVALIGILFYQLSKDRSVYVVTGNEASTIFQLVLKTNFPIIISFLLLLFLIGVLGFVYPSNYADSMTYHLPRVMHWAQNQSVYPYATEILRQVQMPPFAEYHILNLYLLTGDDRLAAWVQWYFLILCSIAISVLTKKLGGNPQMQLFSAVFVATMPAVILQASGTQNDIAVAAWIIIGIVFLFGFVSNPTDHSLIIGTALSIGFALLTKATAYIFLLPFVLITGLQLLKKDIHYVKIALVIGLIIIGINSRHYMRNWQLFGSPLGPSSNYYNELLTPASFASTSIRDIAANIRFNFSNQEKLVLTDRILKELHDLTGLEDNDQRISWYIVPSFFPVSYLDILSEAGAPNPFHYVLIIISVIISLSTWKRICNFHKVMIFCLLFSAVIYNAIMKFQVAGVRLHTAEFMLFGALVAIILGKLPISLQKIITLVLILLSFWWLRMDLNHPFDLHKMKSMIDDRNHIYKSSKTNLYEDVDFLTDQVIEKQCYKIGIEFGSEVWEYPLWSFFSAKAWDAEIEHTYVRNQTNVLLDNSYSPCAVFTNDKKRRQDYPNSQRVKAKDYQLLIIK